MTTKCEKCGEDNGEYLSACAICGEFICSKCEAAQPPDEESPEVVCEECF